MPCAADLDMAQQMIEGLIVGTVTGIELSDPMTGFGWVLRDLDCVAPEAGLFTSPDEGDPRMSATLERVDLDMLRLAVPHRRDESKSVMVPILTACPRCPVGPGVSMWRRRCRIIRPDESVWRFRAWLGQCESCWTIWWDLEEMEGE